MKVYTYTEARQSFAAVLESARKDGAVRIRRRDGQTFLLKPEAVSGSPLDVPGVELGLSREEIIDFVREGRREGF